MSEKRTCETCRYYSIGGTSCINCFKCDKNDNNSCRCVELRRIVRESGETCKEWEAECSQQ